MKYSYVAIVLAAVAQAQSNGIPACAQVCLDKYVKQDTTCSTTDYACICKNFAKVQSDATSCVIAGCGAEVALNQVLPATQKLCKDVAAGSGGSSSAAAATTSAAAETSSAAATGGYGSSTAAATTMAYTTSAAASSTAAGTTPASSPTTTPVTAGAATLSSFGGMAILAIAALAL